MEEAALEAEEAAAADRAAFAAAGLADCGGSCGVEAEDDAREDCSDTVLANDALRLRVRSPSSSEAADDGAEGAECPCCCQPQQAVEKSRDWVA